MSEGVDERGETELRLADVRYRLRPSHQAIRAIERKTGFSLLELVRLGNTHSLSTDNIGIIAAELIRAGAEDAATKAVHEERIADLAYEEGVVRVTSTLTLCLVEAANGGRTASGEAKAAPVTTTGVAGAA